MPTEPLIDLDTIDLTQVVADRADLDRYLKQRGTFSLPDGTLFEDPERKIVVGFKDIRADDWWAPDHIPGRPLFPGALMVETAAQLGSYDFAKYRGKLEEGKFVGFGGLDNVRFRGAVTPECRMIFVVVLKRARKSMFVYDCQGFVDGNLVFEAQVIGVVV